MTSASLLTTCLDNGIALKLGKGPSVDGYETYRLELTKEGIEPYIALLDKQHYDAAGAERWLFTTELRRRVRDFAYRKNFNVPGIADDIHHLINRVEA